MKNHPAVLFLAMAGLVIGPSSLRAEDPIPPKPPGGDTAPPIPATPNPTPGAGGRISPAERLRRLSEELSLTQDQQDKVKAISETYAPQMRELLAKVSTTGAEEDRAKIRELVVKEVTDITALLTPEQKEKFKALVEKRRAERARQQQ